MCPYEVENINSFGISELVPGLHIVPPASQNIYLLMGVFKIKTGVYQIIPSKWNTNTVCLFQL